MVSPPSAACTLPDTLGVRPWLCRQGAEVHCSSPLTWVESNAVERAAPIAGALL